MDDALPHPPSAPRIEYLRVRNFRALCAEGTVAADVTPHFVPERNRSRSFQTFWSALSEMIAAS